MGAATGRGASGVALAEVGSLRGASAAAIARITAALSLCAASWPLTVVGVGTAVVGAGAAISGARATVSGARCTGGAVVCGAARVGGVCPIKVHKSLGKSPIAVGIIVGGGLSACRCATGMAGQADGGTAVVASARAAAAAIRLGGVAGLSAGDALVGADGRSTTASVGDTAGESSSAPLRCTGGGDGRGRRGIISSIAESVACPGETLCNV